MKNTAQNRIKLMLRGATLRALASHDLLNFVGGGLAQIQETLVCSLPMVPGTNCLCPDV